MQTVKYADLRPGDHVQMFDGAWGTAIVVNVTKPTPNGPDMGLVFLERPYAVFDATCSRIALSVERVTLYASDHCTINVHFRNA